MPVTVRLDHRPDLTGRDHTAHHLDVVGEGAHVDLGPGPPIGAHDPVTAHDPAPIVARVESECAERPDVGDAGWRQRRRALEPCDRALGRSVEPAGRRAVEQIQPDQAGLQRADVVAAHADRQLARELDHMHLVAALETSLGTDLVAQHAFGPDRIQRFDVGDRPRGIGIGTRIVRHSGGRGRHRARTTIEKGHLACEIVGRRPCTDRSVVHAIGHEPFGLVEGVAAPVRQHDVGELTRRQPIADDSIVGGERLMVPRETRRHVVDVRTQAPPDDPAIAEQAGAADHGLERRAEAGRAVVVARRDHECVVLVAVELQCLVHGRRHPTLSAPTRRGEQPTARLEIERVLESHHG